MRSWMLVLAAVLFAPSALAQARGGENNATRSGLVVIPRIGVQITGGGETEGDCEGSGVAGTACGTVGEVQADYDDESRLGFGVDVLGNLSGHFRLGGGLWFVPDTQIENDANVETELGSDVTLALIGEGLLDVTPDIALAGRLFLGSMMLIPGGDLDDANDALETVCNGVEALAGDCEVKDGPYFGATFGAGVGVVGSLGRVALRGDFTFQWYTIGLSGVEGSVAGAEFETSTTATGSRLWLSGGLEF